MHACRLAQTAFHPGWPVVRYPDRCCTVYASTIYYPRDFFFLTRANILPTTIWVSSGLDALHRPLARFTEDFCPLFQLFVDTEDSCTFSCMMHHIN